MKKIEENYLKEISLDEMKEINGGGMAELKKWWSITAETTMMRIGTGGTIGMAGGCVASVPGAVVGLFGGVIVGGIGGFFAGQVRYRNQID